MKKRILSFILVLAMLITFIPFAAIEVGAETPTLTYKIKLQTQNVSYAGTDSDGVYAGYKTLDGDVVRKCVNGTFKKGNYDDYYLNLTLSPWMIAATHIHLWTTDDWKPGNFDVSLPKIDNSGYTNGNQPIKIVDYSGWGWMKKGNEWEIGISDVTKRNFTSLGTFDNWAQTIYLGSGDSGTLSKSWNANTTDQYGTYNPFYYDDPASFSMTTQTNASSTSLFSSKL